MSDYRNVSQSNFKNDECYINQQNQGNKSIFNYVTDTSMFINKNQCFDVTPPFLSYIPIGIPTHNVDIENNLRGVHRNNTKCASCKYTPEDINLANNTTDMSKQQQVNMPPHNRPLCKPEFQILPKGYYNMPSRK
jgi:hypothetical protein